MFNIQNIERHTHTYTHMYVKYTPFTLEYSQFFTLFTVYRRFTGLTLKFSPNRLGSQVLRNVK